MRIALTLVWALCSSLQDFMGRVGLDMEGMARSIPPTVCMLCLHGTADTTIPYQARGVERVQLHMKSGILCLTHACCRAWRALYPPQESELCASVVPNSRLILVEGADHNFTQKEAGQQMAAHVVDFVLS